MRKEMSTFNQYEYLLNKRLEVLEMIKPICEVFDITEYDYEITESLSEWLVIYDTKIGCSCNSLTAVLDELIGYIFVNHWVRNRSLGTFKTQTLNVIKQYWVKKEKRND